MKTRGNTFQKLLNLIFIAGTALLLFSCSKKTSGSGTVINPPNPPDSTDRSVIVDQWNTTGNQYSLLQKQAGLTYFDNQTNNYPFIDVDSTQTFQTVDGFGFTLTGGSASLIHGLNAVDRAGLLQELFGNGPNSIGISYLRISIGASDLSSSVFSYDDMPSGQTDVNLYNFSLAQDTVDLVPVLKEIVAINPAIKILGSPWSPPVWMKDNANSVGGSLKTQYYDAYARYFVKYIQQMKANGITIDAVTLQNEPMYGGNNPSMIMTADQAAEFVKTNLGPVFQSSGIQTKIIIWDHNCDNPGYPVSVLNNSNARQYIDGAAFHLYGGEISALTTVHEAHPDKNVYFTEQWTSSTGSFDGDLKWHLKNVIIGSMRNWSKNALEWNLANDPTFGPHTPGGCTQCKGALTIGSTVSRNVGYYIVAHASKFVPAGSVRISSNNNGNINTVAFLTPSGKKVLLVEQDGSDVQGFKVRFKGKWFTSILPGGAVATYVW